MDAYFAILKQIAGQLGLQPTATIAQRPGVKSVVRITVHYPLRKSPDAVTTLVSATGGMYQSTVYQGQFDHKPITKQWQLDDYEAFAKSLAHLRFDKMVDQAVGFSSQGRLLLVERAVGTFHKRLLLVPDKAIDDHAALIDLLQTTLPDAFRLLE